MRLTLLQSGIGVGALEAADTLISSVDMSQVATPNLGDITDTVKILSQLIILVVTLWKMLKPKTDGKN